jgi:hypothetical protein
MTDLPTAEIRSLLLPFWSFVVDRLDGPEGRMRREGCPPETGMCNVTAFLLEFALPAEARPVSGKFRDARGRHGWSDHAMVRIGDRLLDLTQAQFPGRPEAVLTDLDAPEIAIQATTRINTNKAPKAALFVTLLNRPNPIGRRPVVEAWVRQHPQRLLDIADCLGPVLRE